MIWELLDRIGHKLKAPQFFLGLPVMRIVCDRYELSIGITRDLVVESDYAGRAPWWLR